jgi:hypothetical protein
VAVTRTHPAAGDCERIRPGPIAQPVNAASSLAFVAASAWLWRRLSRGGAEVGPDASLYCGLLAANGIGGVAFHGPGDRASHWLHDTALVGTLASMALGHAGWAAGATGVAGLGLAVRPTATNAASVVGTVLVAGAEARRGRRPSPRAGALLLAAAAVNVVSRTGGRCCRPASRWQGHALWHVLTAMALAEWGARAFTPADGGGLDPDGDRSPAGGR